MLQIIPFESRHEMLDTINLNFDTEDFLMIKRNYAYGKCMGFYDEDELIGICSMSIYDDELFIYLFEISDEYKRQGYGKKFFNLLVNQYQPAYVRLHPLDDDAEAFWTNLGFTEGKDEEGEDEYILYLR